MGSRKHIGRHGLKPSATFFKDRLSCVPTTLVCISLACVLLIGTETTHAQSVVVNQGLLPQNHQLPTLGGLIEKIDAKAAPNRFPTSTVRRTIPTMRARYRPQDGDLFGEGQADSAGTSIFDELQEGPQPPATAPRAEPSRGDNPFGEPRVRTPDLDPAPSFPEMDTRPERPTPNQRPERRTPRASGQDGMPSLPDGSEFTPDPDSIPELPTPDGGTRSTEKAGTDKPRTLPREEDDSTDLMTPEKNDFNDEIDLMEPDNRSPRSRGSSRRRRSESSYLQDDRSRRNGSNVYRPAREPSYYSMPTDSRPGAYGQYPPGYDGTNPTMPNSYPPNPYALNPYAPNSYAANPYAAGNPYVAPYAMQNYGANPANPSVASPYGYGYACPPCPPCQQRPPAPMANCGCGPQGGQSLSMDPALQLSQQFTQPASSSCSPAVANEVYEGVVCGDQEIESPYAPSRFPQRTSLVGGGGLGGDGPMLYYTSIFGGWTGLDDLMLSGDEGQIQIGNDDGLALGFAFGQIQGKNLRSEIEVTYRTNDLEGMSLISNAGATQFQPGNGSIESVSGMLNVFWDFKDLPTQRIKPYLGGGIGGVSVDADFQINRQSTLGDGNDTSLAYQWIAGLNYQTNRYSDLFVEYRYFAADSLHFNTTLPAGSIIDGDGELEYRTSNILFGMRLKF